MSAQAALTPDTFKVLLAKITNASTPTLSKEEAKLAIAHLLEPSSTHPAQIGSFLTALRFTGLERDPDVIAGAAEVLQSRALPLLVYEGVSKPSHSRVVDIVGTGGDGHNTFNVSTTAAIVAAGAGAHVMKHGNRASTSSSGSADLLQALGCPLSPPTSRTLAPTTSLPSFQFLLAPNYHPALAPLGPLRKSLPHRTLFNLLGPLINPARPAGIVIGVAHQDLGPVFAKALSMDKDIEKAFVVCGAEQLDEISCEHPTTVWHVTKSQGLTGDASIQVETISPVETFGVAAHSLSSVSGGSVSDNATIFQRLLLDRASPVPKDLVPILDFVLINASAVLVVAGIAHDFKEGIAKARESIETGKAWEAFESWRRFDNLE